MSWCKDYEEFKKDLRHSFENDLYELLNAMIRDGYLTIEDRASTQCLNRMCMRVSISDHTFKITFRGDRTI